MPSFGGLYSKDAILVQAFGFMLVHPEHSLLFVLPLMTAGITTFYMFRMWFMTFTGKPRDAHVFERAHESPWLMTVPLILLGTLSVCVAWGAEPWDAHGSQLAHLLHESEPASVARDFGPIVDHEAQERGGYPGTAGSLALLMVLLGFAFAGALYYKH